MRAMVRSWRWKDYVLGAMALLMLGAAYTSVLIVQRQSQLAAVSRYNLTWLVSQAGLEVSRLYGTVAASLVPGSGIDDDELDLRLAIVENRVQLLQGGDMADFIAESPDLKKIVSDFGKTVAEARRELGDGPNSHRSLHLSLHACLQSHACAALRGHHTAVHAWRFHCREEKSHTPLRALCSLPIPAAQLTREHQLTLKPSRPAEKLAYLHRAS